MITEFFQYVLAAIGANILIYFAAWLVFAAYFNRKYEYHNRIVELMEKERV